MLQYALKQETWPTTQQELEGRGVGKDTCSESCRGARGEWLWAQPRPEGTAEETE